MEHSGTMRCWCSPFLHACSLQESLLVHSCMHVGAALSGAEVLSFAHNDVGSLGAALAARRGGAKNCLILTVSVFSRDGDRAPLELLADLAEAHDAWLMTDDAHGFGVVAPCRPPICSVCCSAALPAGIWPWERPRSRSPPRGTATRP